MPAEVELHFGVVLKGFDSYPPAGFNDKENA
jgi:hypothetical protein